MSDLEFRVVLANLAKQANCSSIDINLWDLMLTHESFAHEQGKWAGFDVADSRTPVRLVYTLENIGKSAVQLATYEYCLDEKGMDPVETSRCVQALRVVFAALAEEFDLLRFIRFGRALKSSNVTEALKQSLTERFFGGVVASSSYENLKSFVWRTLGRTLFSGSGILSYATIDPKSWLQEYTQQHFHGRNQTFKLLHETGPDHAKEYEASVSLPDGKTASAVGKTIRDAEKLAAAALIERYRLEEQMPRRHRNLRVSSSDWKALGPPYLDPTAAQIDRRLLNSAMHLAERLNIAGLSPRHLAVAIALPSSQYKESFTNARYKLLGDGLQLLTFPLFAFRELPTRVFAFRNVSQWTAMICSQTYQSRLFDHLNLVRLVRADHNIPLSEVSKADTVKAICAAVYLSFRDFSRFFKFLTERLGPWCRQTVSSLSENILEMSEPKTLLQEVLQGHKHYRADYIGNIQTGPAHAPSFSTTLVIKDESTALVSTRGNGKTLQAAQQAAALSTLQDLLPGADRRPRSVAALRFWRTYFDRLLAGEPGTLVGICGIEQFRSLNSVAAFRELVALSASYPSLSPYLENPDFIRVITRSIGRLPIASPSEALSIARNGITLVTGKSPDDVEAFTSAEVDVWLADVKRASAALKLPTKQIDLPFGIAELADFRRVREWQVSITADDRFTIPESMFSHILTLLESLEDDNQRQERKVNIAPHTKTNDCRSIEMRMEGNWSRVQLERLVERLSVNSFFSGVQDNVRFGSTACTIDVKGAFLEENSPARAYVAILEHFYQIQDHLRSLYRIMHDLKNQIVAVRNYALRAKDDPSSRYRMFVAIEGLQNELRDREIALGVYLRAADESPATLINIQQIVRGFITNEIALIPANIRASFTENLEIQYLLGNKEMLISLFTNLTKNAIEAMPNGGRLSFSVSYQPTDCVLEIDIADTGVGIALDAIPDLFTSLRSTKKKGMGLGLATVKAVVEQHDGLIDVSSKIGEGTRFIILLPLKIATGAATCEH